MSDLIQRFPNVVLAEVPCPIVGCDAGIAIEGALIVGWANEEDGTPRIRIGSAVDSTAVEFHMIEHGIDPKREDPNQ